VVICVNDRELKLTADPVCSAMILRLAIWDAGHLLRYCLKDTSFAFCTHSLNILTATRPAMS
jgi:hypothetical protein